MANTVSAGQGYVFGGSTVPSGGTTRRSPSGPPRSSAMTVQFPAGFDFSTLTNLDGHGRHRQRQRREPGPDPDRPQRRPAHALPRPDPDGRGHGQYRHRDQRHQRRSDLPPTTSRLRARDDVRRQRVPRHLRLQHHRHECEHGAVHRQLSDRGGGLRGRRRPVPRRVPPAGDRPQGDQRHLEARDQRHPEQRPYQPAVHPASGRSTSPRGWPPTSTTS